jgi:phosphate/sulfate permease
MYGHKVMDTIGDKIAKLTFSRGYAAQVGTALTVLTATQSGLSVSTTHCLIGAITGVGLVEGTDKVNMDTIRKILMSWLVTIPAASGFAALLFWLSEAISPLAHPR